MEGEPLNNIGVREVWQNYTLESRDHEEDLITNSDGYVKFPRRIIKVTLLKRLLYPIYNAMGGVHASWGPSARVIVLVPDATKEIGSEEWVPTQPLPSVVTVHSLRH